MGWVQEQPSLMIQGLLLLLNPANVKKDLEWRQSFLPKTAGLFAPWSGLAILNPHWGDGNGTSTDEGSTLGLPDDRPLVMRKGTWS